MVQKIIWNKTAQRSFDQIMNYLHDEYSKDTAEKFFNVVYHRINQLTSQPYILVALQRKLKQCVKSI
jgi:plasmid stabilization system protein ParE